MFLEVNIRFSSSIMMQPTPFIWLTIFSPARVPITMTGVASASESSASGLMMETRTRTFLCGDLFTQGGAGEKALTESDILGGGYSARLNAEIRINKPLMITAAFPRFLAVGDKGIADRLVKYKETLAEKVEKAAAKFCRRVTAFPNPQSAATCSMRSI